jgi:hypothetical protein
MYKKLGYCIADRTFLAEQLNWVKINHSINWETLVWIVTNEILSLYE